MSQLHHYNATTKWVGNRGQGTADYKAYDRNHDITFEGKAPLLCTSDVAFRGDKSRNSPEELLVAALSGCHMLWYLHLCAVNGVVVTEYVDNAAGLMQENKDGSGEFTEVVLSPRVTVTERSMITKADSLHHEANKLCFIARSVNFPVRHNPTTVVALPLSA
jgi:organic hydroperoxide reductase OsmC/OhrA